MLEKTPEKYRSPLICTWKLSICENNRKSDGRAGRDTLENQSYAHTTTKTLNRIDAVSDTNAAHADAVYGRRDNNEQLE